MSIFLFESMIDSASDTRPSHDACIMDSHSMFVGGNDIWRGIASKMKLMN